jgi:hypothetical protein
MKKLILSGLAVTLAIAVACGGDKKSPTSPSATDATTDAAAGPDGITLKATAPGQVSPANGATLEDFNTALVITKSTGKFEQGESFAYRFQVLNGSTVVKEIRQQSLTWTPEDLAENTTFGWRARAEQGSYFGPWSATWTFKTPEQPEGYIRGNELYDPLVNGKTIGQIIGNVTIIPGQGAKLNDSASYIRYILPETLEDGSFSILVTNILNNTDGNKTKLFAMSQGDSDITTNPRRMTIEKRGTVPGGPIAWRVITSRDQIDTVGGERVTRTFDPSHDYLWTATWGNFRFDLRIKDGGVNGKEIYSFGKNYDGYYDPSPHYAFIGGPTGRSGLQAGSVPGVIIRQVWISSRPRPNFANK